MFLLWGSNGYHRLWATKQIFTRGYTCLYDPLDHVYQTLSDVQELRRCFDVGITADYTCWNGAGAVHLNRKNYSVTMLWATPYWHKKHLVWSCFYEKLFLLFIINNKDAYVVKWLVGIRSFNRFWTHCPGFWSGSGSLSSFQRCPCTLGILKIVDTKLVIKCITINTSHNDGTKF